MNPWQATFFGLKQIPRELADFEIQAFFTFTATERQLIEQRRRAALKLGLALQIGFLRMSGRVLDAARIVPPAACRFKNALHEKCESALDGMLGYFADCGDLFALSTDLISGP